MRVGLCKHLSYCEERFLFTILVYLLFKSSSEVIFNLCKYSFV